MARTRSPSFTSRVLSKHWHLTDHEVEDLASTKNPTITLLANTLREERKARRAAEDNASRLVRPDTTGQ